MNQPIQINGHTFRPTEVIEQRNNYYLANGIMEVYDVDEPCTALKWDSKTPWEVVFTCRELNREWGTV